MKQKNYLIIIFVLLAGTLFSKKMKEGSYRGLLISDRNKVEIPFNFFVTYKGKKPVITIVNADEKILVDEIRIKGDSVSFKMPVFDTEFRTRMVGNDLEGIWINHYKTSNNIMPFKAVFGEYKRFMFTPGTTSPSFEGRWETVFSPDTKDSSRAIGLFHHIEQTEFLTGTFLTETGDYRYLEGIKHENTLYLSCFDGAHAYLFIAELKGDLLTGNFYSGATWSEPWVAKLNPNAKLRDAEQITFLKNKDATIDFSFPGLDKKPVSLSDKKYANKPVVIQLMGSWCPNCMDESRYFSEVYKQFQKEGLEIVALAFEKTTDFDKAKLLLTRMKTRLNMGYDILITQQSGKEKAGEALWALNQVSAFPTTLFLNRQHQVVRIHTGFSGPATGKDYEDFKETTETLIRNLLKE